MVVFHYAGAPTYYYIFRINSLNLIRVKLNPGKSTINCFFTLALYQPIPNLHFLRPVLEVPIDFGVQALFQQATLLWGVARSLSRSVNTLRPTP